MREKVLWVLCWTLSMLKMGGLFWNWLTFRCCLVMTQG